MGPYSIPEIEEIVGDLTTIVLRFIRNNPEEKHLVLRVPQQAFLRCRVSKLDLTKAVREVAEVAEIEIKLVVVAG